MSNFLRVLGKFIRNQMRLEKYKIDGNVLQIPVAESYKDCFTLIKSDQFRLTGKVKSTLSIKIHDNATIGAGAIVTKDVPANATVAGVPAKVLNYNNPGRYVNRRYPTPLPSSPSRRP